MQYNFQLVSATSVDCEKYQSAFHCAVVSVKSILYDYPYTVEFSVPIISVSPFEPTEGSMALSEMKDLVVGAFVDAGGSLYPEFSCIKPTMVNS